MSEILLNLFSTIIQMTEYTLGLTFFGIKNQYLVNVAIIKMLIFNKTMWVSINTYILYHC